MLVLAPPLSMLSLRASPMTPLGICCLGSLPNSTLQSDADLKEKAVTALVTAWVTRDQMEGDTREDARVLARMGKLRRGAGLEER